MPQTLRPCREQAPSMNILGGVGQHGASVARTISPAETIEITPMVQDVN
jgi:hypothetical protein